MFPGRLDLHFLTFQPSKCRDRVSWNGRELGSRLWRCIPFVCHPDTFNFEHCDIHWTCDEVVLPRPYVSLELIGFLRVVAVLLVLDARGNRTRLQTVSLVSSVDMPTASRRADAAA
jgi:hypothetical protein